MLLPYTTLTYYGPGAGAAVMSGGGSVLAGAKGTGRTTAILSGVGAITRARGSRMVHSPATLAGAGAIAKALTKGAGRTRAVIGNTGLSQQDVTGAVLEAQVEPGVTLKQAMRLITAALAGKLSGAGTGTVTIRDVNDTTDRIVATVDSNGNRSVVTLDPS